MSTDNHDHDPTLDPRTCGRIDRLEAAVQAMSSGGALPIAMPAPAPATIDITEHLAAIERAAAAEIDAIMEAGRRASAGLQEIADALAPAPPPEPPSETAIVTLPAAPRTEAAPGWIKGITERVDEAIDDEPITIAQPAPEPVRAQVFREEKVIVADEWGKAEIRYQLALQAFNGSSNAKAMMSEAAHRRGISVEELAKRIIDERRQVEHDVMAEF